MSWTYLLPLLGGNNNNNNNPIYKAPKALASEALAAGQSWVLIKTPKGPQNPKFWPPKKQVFRKTVSCSITCQLELDISSTRAINNVRHVAVVPPRGVHYKQKYVAFLQHHL